MWCDIFVPCTILKHKKEFSFFSSEALLLHQTIIREWFMLLWKTLTPTFILNHFLLNIEKSLTPTLLTHLRLCKMIISERIYFFHFLKILIFWAKKCGKRTIMTQNLQKACPHSIWGATCNMIMILVCLWLLVFLVRFRDFFIFRNFKFCAKNGVKGQKLAKNNLQWCCWHQFLRNSTSNDWDFLERRCKMMIYPGFFSF